MNSSSYKFFKPIFTVPPYLVMKKNVIENYTLQTSKGRNGIVGIVLQLSHCEREFMTIYQAAI